jgi:hypothetical protein
MDQHPRGLIDYDAISILVKDIEWKWFGVQVCVLRRKPLNIEQVPGLEPRSRLSPSAIEYYLSPGNHLLNH